MNSCQNLILKIILLGLCDQELALVDIVEDFIEVHDSLWRVVDELVVEGFIKTEDMSSIYIYKVLVGLLHLPQFPHIKTDIFIFHLNIHRSIFVCDLT